MLNKNPQSDFYIFLKSLAGAKELLINVIPYENTLPDLSMNYNVLIHTYKKNIDSVDEDYSKLLELFLRLEKDQLHYIQREYYDNEITSKGKKYLELIFNIYKDIVKQLIESTEEYELVPIIL